MVLGRRGGGAASGRPCKRSSTTTPASVRWGARREIQRKYLTVGDVHPEIAARIRAAGARPVLDAGCGDGELSLALGRWPVISLDRDPLALLEAPRPSVRADIMRLPFRDSVFGAVAAVYVLYFFERPVEVLAEIRRVLRPGGLFASVTVSRDDLPELIPLLEPELIESFDAENGPAQVEEVFGNVEVDLWNLPALWFESPDGVREYLGARNQRLARDPAELAYPLTVRKMGAMIYARR